ncbi:MAG: peroxiredoxin-like family protein [Acidimicrobiia bacterium]
MREAYPDIAAAGADVLAIGTGAAFQAEHLMRNGMPFDCVIDPDANFYRAVGIGRVGPTEWLRPSVISRYVAAWKRGGRQGRVTGDWRRLSGVAIVDPDRTIRYLHRATNVGDYPAVAEIVGALPQPGAGY